MWRRRWHNYLKNTKEDDEKGQPTAASMPYLPDNVIENIMSFLPVKDASYATFVSRQWSTLWPSFPVIDLDQESFIQPQRFLRFLRHSLRRCRKQRHLDKLSIRANLDYGYVLVSEWVDFAIKRFVKELDIVDLDKNDSLKLENVRLYATTEVSVRVSLPLLKTMSLKAVQFLDDDEVTATNALPSLVSGCPCIEHLSIHSCSLGYSTLDLEISSHTLKSLEIMHCHCKGLSVAAENLESFTFYSDCTCRYHMVMYLMDCDSLKYLDISCKGLKLLLMHDCQQIIENSLNTPNLESFEFGGCLKAKVHFVEAPSNLLKVNIRIMNPLWSTEYYSFMRDFLASFDCSKKVKIHILDAEGVLIPEHLRLAWSPPLPSIKQLQLYFSAPQGDGEYCLRPSLIWMAPSAEILPFLIHDDDDEYDDYEDDDDDSSTDEDNDNDDGYDEYDDYEDDDDDSSTDEDNDNDDGYDDVDDDDV